MIMNNINNAQDKINRTRVSMQIKGALRANQNAANTQEIL
jgi:hypothetical protein